MDENFPKHIVCLLWPGRQINVLIFHAQFRAAIGFWHKFIINLWKEGCATDKKYYEDKMREILERDDKTEEEAIRTAEDLMFLEIQYCMDKQF